MPFQKKPKKRGRKERPIDLEKLRKLASFMHTDDEMSVAMDVALATFKKWKQRDEVKLAIVNGRADFKRSLRAHQVAIVLSDAPMKGNGVPWAQRVSMSVHLGKQYLEQKDKVEHSGDQKSPVVPVDKFNRKEYEKKFPTIRDLWAELDAQIFGKKD